MTHLSSNHNTALLVHVEFPVSEMREDLVEFQELVRSAGILSRGLVTAARQKPDPKTFVGSGKAEEIRIMVASENVAVVIFNHALHPAQQRNLERLVACRVLGRTELILDIFAQRAHSFEGKLQVELAQLNHLSTRLIRGWTHLERQKGGIGLRGPGEKQLEVDRRLIKHRIKIIQKRLLKVTQQRALGRHAREKAAIFTIACVGYTNAGKSTLFNRLCGADVYVADQLFATLDPTLRKIHLPGLGEVLLADTVGFIRHLPHDLIAAFRATLEEVQKADLLLHVIDSHDPEQKAHIEQVQQVLTQIEADHVPQLLVYNKIDLQEERLPSVEYDTEGYVGCVYLSAKTGQGLEILTEVISKWFSKKLVDQWITLSHEDVQLRAKLYRLEAVVSESSDEDGRYRLHIRLPMHLFQALFPHLPP